MYGNLKLSKRFDLQTRKESSQGSVFINQNNINADLSAFNIVHAGIDTLKQKVIGTLDNDVVNRLFSKLVCNHKAKVKLDGYRFNLTRAPFKSGYRYMFYNKSLGFHIFIGSFHSREWMDDCISKFELSPQVIHEHGLNNIHFIVKSIFNAIYRDFEYTGVEAHFAVDVQGWKPEQEFMENLTTMSRIKRCHNTSQMVATDLQTVAVRYAKSESFLIGKSGNAQLAVYNKTEESKITGKESWWNLVYSQNSKFKSNQDVYRIEVRMHDSLLKRLGDPSGDASHEIKSIFQLIPHQNSLWKYGLYRLFRYHYPSSKVVRPEWQCLVEDVVFDNIQSNEFFYKRVSHKIVDSTIKRNLVQISGHLTSAYAKANISNEDALESLKSLPIYKHLDYMHADKIRTTEQWQQMFIESLEEKRERFVLPDINPFTGVDGYIEHHEIYCGQAFNNQI
ncbi:MAG: hypothetical protein ISEC1_P2062 [Thiomicrorhabdus sp.]|nr:MAG: hypothetical protein ISEC1_P2062 [Thiomicrorhabdus sp.]